MRSEAAFLSDWRLRLQNGQCGVVLADAHHPLEVYLGASDVGHPLVQIRSNIKPQLPELSEHVVVSRTETSPHWLLTLSLQDHQFTEVFLHLVAHLISASRGDVTPQAAWLTVSGVLDEWKRLLRARPMGLLSLEELRGFVGEIWLMLNRFLPILGIDAAINGWLGPLSAPQDFWYPGSGFHEAKSIGPTATSIRISSEYQLDEPTMELVVMHVPQVVETELGATNLVLLVERVRTALADAGVRQDALTLRLSQMGVDEDQPYYADMWFRVTTVEVFELNGLFPAVRQSALPSGVKRVRYSIERTAIAPFLVSTEYL